MTKCPHDWSLEPHTGPISAGQCQKCGEIRTNFNNVQGTVGWNQWTGVDNMRREEASRKKGGFVAAKMKREKKGE
jgi:hypothetical protein